MGEPSSAAAPWALLALSPDDARTRGVAGFLLDVVPFADAAEAAGAVARVLAFLTSGAARVTVRGADDTIVADATRPDVLVEDKPFGQVDVLWESAAAGIYQLRVGPGRAIPTHEHRRMHEAELVLADGLLLQGQPAEAGTARRWPQHLPHRYDNPTDHEVAVLCVDRPPFQPDDEVEVPAPVDGFTVVPAVRWFR